MNAEPFLDDADFRLITAEAFDFMFKNELKRAMRSQNYVTLLTIRPMPLAAGEQTAADQRGGAARQPAVTRDGPALAGPQ